MRHLTGNRLIWGSVVCCALIIGPTVSGVRLKGQSPTAAANIIGLSLFINNGSMKPLTFYGNPARYLNEIDIVTSTPPQATDDGIDSLIKLTEPSKMDWRGVKVVDEDWRQSADGTYQRQRFYRNADWMNEPSQFLVYPTDGRGRRLGAPLAAAAGRDDGRADDDDFFVRRFVVRQIATGCKTRGDCTGARFFAQQLVQVRHNRNAMKQAAVLPQETAALELEWSQSRASVYTVAVKHAGANSLPYGYGFQIALDVVSSPANGSYYMPGEAVKLRTTFRDGSGNRLHAIGSLPTYGQFMRDEAAEGVGYYDGARFRSTLYYALKHREGNILASLAGPTNKLRQSKSILERSQLFETQALTQTTSTDGYTGMFTGVPPFTISMGGMARWEEPVSDTVTFTLPTDSLSGTYVAAIKARRMFGGEALNRAATTTLQVGTTVPTMFTPTTGNCQTCHQGPSGFDNILHGVSDRSACFACHPALSFEPDNALELRVHSVHSRSRRFGADSRNCSVCHLSTPDGPALGWLAGAGFETQSIGIGR